MLAHSYAVRRQNISVYIGFTVLTPFTMCMITLPPWKATWTSKQRWLPCAAQVAMSNQSAHA